MQAKTLKLVALFFLLLGLTPLLIVICYNIRKDIISKEMISKLERAHLHKLIIPEDSVNWVEKHEILVNNQLFDIHSLTLADGVYIFTGLFDDEETELRKLFGKASGMGCEENKLLTQFLNWIQFSYNKSDDNELCFHFRLNQPVLFVPAFLINPLKKVITPPPDVSALSFS